MKKSKVLDQEYEKLVTVAEGSVSEARGVLKEEFTTEEKLRNIEMEILSAKKNTLTYEESLAKSLYSKLNESPHIGWEFRVAPTRVGVVMEIEDPDKRLFRSAFRTTKDVFLDINAVDVFVNRAFDTMNRYYEHSDIAGPHSGRNN